MSEMTKEEIQKEIENLKRLLASMCPTKVLIVEDDPMDLVILQRELSKFRCKVTVAQDGAEAVERIKEDKFDLILLDQALPKLTGGEVLQRTAGFRQHSKVIIVTGHSDSVPAIIRSGAVLAFAKPINQLTLEALGLVLI